MNTIYYIIITTSTNNKYTTITAPDAKHIPFKRNFLIIIHYIHYAGYIDLSKRRVDPEDVVKCEERYNKAKAVHSVMR